ncbi:MAG TPA: gamma-glutamyltransferase [Stellaceae bacterium]|nr:gamma-glutamyltransferase [Stellaceae bacterium]
MGRVAKRRLCAALALALLPAAPAAAQTPAMPEPATGRTAQQAARARHDMVVAANPLAAAAGRDVLRRGGSAVDAAIATQLVLNLVEPQSSGIGGGAFLVLWSAAEHRVVTFDGRETAPAAAKPDRFIGSDGKPLAFYDAVVGARSVGVPGLLRMLALAHRRYGRLPWAELFQPAIRLAEAGAPVSPRLHALLMKDPYLARSEPARSYFYDAAGAPKTMLVNPDLAATLRLIAEGGADAFYTGPVAADIVAALAAVPGSPGDMTASDLAGYRAKQRAPVCGPYRGHRLCGMGPPSSGAVTLLEMLGMLGHFDLAPDRPPSARAVHLLAEAGRLAYADRARWLGDADFVAVPVAGLLDPDYLASRARLIDPERAMPGAAAPGDPPGSRAREHGDNAAPELPSTSEIAIIDRAGDALSMTTTIENAFGSRVMVRGFLLNNELTDFSFVPEVAGRTVANRLAPGKRPLSAMAPTLVFDRRGRVELAVGSAGGPAIINDVAKTIIAVLNWHYDMAAAIELPDDGNRNGATEIEAGPSALSMAAALKARGHIVRLSDRPSGLAGIRVTPQGYEGAADPRRDGAALGD